jgi:cellulose synthase/poly-beta-1,6-N-acetylglucosamine synthase-like glycosyltransferase
VIASSMAFFMWVFQLIYVTMVLALLVYGVNNVIMLFFCQRRFSKKVKSQREVMAQGLIDWPMVTVQVPVYNEANVIERVIDAVAQLDYPREKLSLQILDDSNDATGDLIDERIQWWKNKKQDLKLSAIRRSTRAGYKAGALSEAHEQVEGEFVALFDADFVPQPDFLKKSLPFMVKDPSLGFLQARWGHLNREASWMTKVQAIGIDGHFMVEQSARCWNNLYLNFNGTAGLWRKNAIEEAGGWSWDTLTEDMDLSYRVQLVGWKAEYLPELVVPAEIPGDLPAFKSQQFRWAKGSIQCAKKILPLVWAKDGLSWRFIQAFFHMTHYAIHPMMVMMALLSWPVLGAWEGWPSGWSLGLLLALLFSMFSTNTLYLFSQWKAGTHSLKRILELPLLMILGVGVALNNSKAVLEALLGKSSEFIRTPKAGEAPILDYVAKVPKWVLFELLLGVYCGALWLQRLSDMSWFSPFVLIYALGFLLVGLSGLKSLLMSGYRIRGT